VSASLAAALVAGCAGAPVAADVPAGLFDDAHVAAPAAPVDPDDAFRLSPSMAAYLHDEILPRARRGDARRALVEALYQRGRLRLEYDASTTRNAAQAFEARAGNCLALVIMTGAFAKAMGLEVTYQEVDAEEAWSRAGGLYFLSGHVNLVLSRAVVDRQERRERAADLTVDFLPPSEAASQRARPIAEKTVLAMYLNNRAAEAMLAGQLDAAYWRARDAIRIDPSYASAYNTLGVVYLRRHDAARADAALRAALARAPGDARAMANEAQALRDEGREGEARALEARLAAVEPFPPFHFFDQARAAFAAGRVAQARELLLREIARAPDYHEFHYWLALCDARLGDLDGARRELSAALEDADKRSDRDLYAAKLDRLEAHPRSPRVE
jgi:Flp pilus assembly protein TadD